MTLWLFIILLTGLGVLSVLLPLARPRMVGQERAEERVYRHQLDQIELDRANGLIAAPEVEAARAEIARRLLAASGNPDVTASEAPARRRVASVLAVVGVPAAALSLYLGLGSPDLPGQPLAARLTAAPEKQDLAALVAQVERHLGENPEDGRGWEVLAPIYSDLGRAADAVRAYGAAIRLLGESAARTAGLGEALVREANGIVTENARGAFERALAQAPGAVKPRYYLAMRRAQDGDVRGAAAEWRAMLADAPADAPWRTAVAERVTWAEGELAKGTGPGADEVRAAEAMPAEERREFIEGMVARLASRLEGGEKDLDGWLRLARAYAVLGQSEKAKAALGEARALFAGDLPALERIETLGRGLGQAEVVAR